MDASSKLQDHATEIIAAYGQIPYPAYSHRLTHPDAIATTAALFGMQPCPVEHCRVLDVGCAAGANIIPMAYSLPGSQFVGVDISPDQIAAGQKWVAELGLQNIRLEARSLLDIDDSFGTFDYIIAHGFFTWVPALVQDKLLEVCSQNLAPNGIAWISYNTLPGWSARKTLRDMILYHIRHVADPDARLDQALQFLHLLSKECRPQTADKYKEFLGQIIAEIQKLDFSSDDRGYFYHEYLDETSQPVFFQQFVDMAAQHGLKYLADAEVHGMTPFEFPPETVEMISSHVATNIEFEQHLDFLRNRQFRQTLLCHDEVDLNRLSGAERMANLKVRAHLKLAGSEINLDEDEPVIFITPADDHVSLSLSLQKAAFLHLAEIYPQYLPFTRLLQVALNRLGLEPPGAELSQYAEQVSSALIAAYLSADAVEFTTWLPDYANHVSAQPQASPVVRLQARSQRRVTSLFHNMVNLDLIGRLVLQMLDGRLDRSAILAALTRRLVNSDYELLPGEKPLETDISAYLNLIDLNLDAMLQDFAEKGLLVG